MADFLIRAIITGLVVALVAGPLGCFVVWRRMAYFGDTLAHAALMGIALGLMLNTPLQATIVIASVLIALLLAWLEGRSNFATDTLLGIFAHSALALGLVLISFSATTIDLMGFLFGDLLTVSNGEVAGIAVCAAAIGAVLFVCWKPLLNLTLHEELATVEGLQIGRYRMLLMLLIAVLVAVSMKVVGVLLITAMLIIPPAAARGLSRSPHTMAVLASIAGCIAVIAGISASWFWNTPVGPGIVVAAAVLFMVGSILGRQGRKY